MRTPTDATVDPPEAKRNGIAQHSSASNEHYTPPPIIAVAREAMGSIELDPASCDRANREIVKADRYFTIDDDGLAQPWNARTFFCNPPGGRLAGTNRSQAQAFFRKAVREWRERRAGQGIFLGFTLELLRLTQEERPHALEFPFCVLRERADFYVEFACDYCGRYAAAQFDKDGSDRCKTRNCPGRHVSAEKLGPEGQPTHANVIVFLSDDLDAIARFDHAASTIGSVCVPWGRCKR